MRTPQGTVLVLTEPTDTTAGRVCSAIHRRGASAFRLDTADFPQRIQLTATATDAGWRGTLQTRDQDVKLESIVSVYVRRPAFFDLPAHLTDIERRHAGLEARYGFGGVLRSLPARWCNDMSRSADAAYKPTQLDLFRRCGFHVPRTLITNQEQAVREFADTVKRMVCKPLATTVVRTHGRGHAVYTQLLTKQDMAELTGVQHTAHLFQEFVEKQFETRLTVVGDRVFAARINADSERAYVDWRSDYTSLTYERIEPPDDVTLAVRRYMNFAGLTFGAFDFAVDRDSTWYVLECNPEGQWEWLADACDLPIAEAIADYLVANG